MKVRKSRVWLAAMLSLGLIAPAGGWGAKQAEAASELPPGVAFQQDYENGQTGGWFTFGCTGDTALAVAAVGGTQALKSPASCKPAVELNALLSDETLQPGETYTFTAKVQASAATNAHFTMKTTDGDGDRYDWLQNPTAVSAAGWTALSGSFTVPEGATGLMPYLESDPAADLYIDDVQIFHPVVVRAYTFDSGAEGWTPYGGGGTVGSVATSAYEGAGSLLSSGRTQTYQGPSLNLASVLEKGASYRIAAHVKMNDGEAASTIKLTAHHGTDSSAGYDTIAQADDVGADNWTTIEGDYTWSADDALVAYFESSSATASFLVDSVTIEKTAPAPLGSSDAPGGGGGATALAADFEDGTAQGWGPRGGVTVASAADEHHGGSYSLKITGRTQSWNGPAIDMTSKLQKGGKYHVSVWAKLASGEPDAAFRVSLQVDKAGADTAYDQVVGNTTVSASKWTELTGDYTLAKDFDALSLYVETDSALSSFYIDDFKLSSSADRSIQTDIPSIYEAYADDFLVGAEVQPEDLLGASGELVKKHFNSIVAGNQMKPSSIQPTEGQFNWGPADEIANFARDNGLHLRGHTLVWHQQVPDWFFQDEQGNWLTPSETSKQLVLTRLETHIRALMNRYKDVVDAWDVVNEVIDPSESDGMRRSKWYELTGTDYIDTAFRVAHEVDPNAKLFINDFNSIEDPRKEQLLYNFVKAELEKGVPISGIGHQMHINIYSPSMQAVKDGIDKFAELGLTQEITELDMSVYNSDSQSYATIPHDLLVQQGYRYKELFETLRGLKDKIGRVTFWGMSDDTTWLRSHPVSRLDAPLPFDDFLQAKPAYWGLVDPSRLEVLIKNANAGKATIAVDGALDNIWSAAVPAGIQSGSSASAGSFRTAWDDGHLYLYAKVADATVQAGDRLDVYVNGGAGGEAKHYAFARSGAAIEGAAYKAVSDANGYVIEAAIPLEAPALARKLGFDVRAADDDGETTTLTSWNDPTSSQDGDLSKIGTLTLSDAYKLTVAINGAATIDGKANESAWQKANLVSTGTWVTGSSGSTAQVRTMWDDHYLYLFAHVTDSKLSDVSRNDYEQDSVEAFVDQNNGKTDTYEPDDGQYRVNYKNAQSYNGNASSANFTTATQVVYGTDGQPTGYDVEARIDLDKIEPKAGDLIGFDFQVNNDEDGDGVRDSVAIWSDPTGLSYQNTSKWGVLVLGAKAPSGGTIGGITTGGDGSGTAADGGDGAAAVVTTATIGADGRAAASVDKDAFAKALAQAGGRTVTIKIEGAASASGASVRIPDGLLQSAAQSGVKEVKIDTGLAVVNVALSLFADAAGDVGLTVDKADVSALPSDVRAAIGDNPVYDFGLSVGGAPVEGFDGHQVKVSLPFKLPAGENPSRAVVYYIAGDGSMQVVKYGRYDAAAETISFAPAHFSKYAAAVAKTAFTDLANVPWAQDGIEGLAARGIVNGKAAGFFDPQASVTRSEFVQMLLGTLDLSDTAAASTFSDAKPDAWYAASLATAQKLGIVNGKPDGSFGVNDLITRQEMAVMIDRALKAADVQLDSVPAGTAFKDEAQIAAYAKEAVAAIRQAGIIQGRGDGTFAPAANASRAEAAVALYRLFAGISL